MDNIVVEAELIKNEYNEFKKTEENLHNELDSLRFFDIMDTVYGYNYKIISRFIQGWVHSFNERHDFNIALRKIKRQYNIDIMDSILFMEETIMLNKIIKFIDDETEWVLKDELAEKYNLNKKINNIFDIIY